MHIKFPQHIFQPADTSGTVSLQVITFSSLWRALFTQGATVGNRRKILATACTALLALTLTAPLAATALAHGNDGAHHPLTRETAAMIASGEIRLPDGRVDSLLYQQPVLVPDADDDGDGLRNSLELYTYSQGGRTYYGYNTHPRLEDSDGDGHIDSADREPLVWNISSRDMALFMELSYRDDPYIKKVLNRHAELTDLHKDRQEYALMNKELAPFWRMRQSFHESNGFDAVLFENTSNYVHLPKNSVQVLAVRGTSAASDYDDDLNLFFGTDPDQALSMKNTLLHLGRDESINNLYVTGHSLGGYLAARGLVEAEKHHITAYKQAFTFNAPKVRGNAFNNWLNDVNTTISRLTAQGRARHYIVDNDSTIAPVGTFDGALSIGTSANGHGSRSYFEERINTLPDWMGTDFRVGKRHEIHQSGYRQPNLSELHYTTVLTDAEVYQLSATPETILEGGSVNILDNISATPALPPTARVEDITDYSTLSLATARPEPYIATARVTFTDGSSSTVTVPIQVTKPPSSVPTVAPTQPALPTANPDDLTEILTPEAPELQQGPAGQWDTITYPTYPTSDPRAQALRYSEETLNESAEPGHESKTVRITVALAQTAPAQYRLPDPAPSWTFTLRKQPKLEVPFPPAPALVRRDDCRQPATLSFDAIPWARLVYTYDVQAFDSAGQATSDPLRIARYRVHATLRPENLGSYHVLAGDSGWSDTEGLTYEFDAAPNCRPVTPRAPLVLPAPEHGGYGTVQAPVYGESDPLRDIFVYTIANGGYNAAGEPEENGPYSLTTAQLTEQAAKQYRIADPGSDDGYRLAGEEARWVIKLPFLPYWALPSDAPTADPLPTGHPGAYVPTTAPTADALPTGHPSEYVPTIAPTAGPLPTGHPSAYVPQTAPTADALPTGHPSEYVPSDAPSADVLPTGHPTEYVPQTAPAADALPTGHPSAYVPTDAPTAEALPSGQPSPSSSPSAAPTPSNQLVASGAPTVWWLTAAAAAATAGFLVIRRNHEAHI